MKIGKIIKWSVLLIVLVVIVAVTVLVMRLDGIIRQQVEVQSTASTMLKTLCAACQY